MKLYKTTIVIWSQFDPDASGIELSELASDAESGESYCSKLESHVVEDAKADADWDGTEFFDCSEHDDLCDTCMRSGVEVHRTDEDGNTICVDCDAKRGEE